MIQFLLVLAIFSGFTQKWWAPKGTHEGFGRISVCDSDRDGWVELIFGYYEDLHEQVVVYELYPDDMFHLEAVIDTMTNEAWEVGDFDNDGFIDLILSGDYELPVVGPQIYESPDSFSYPTEEVWRDTIGFPLVIPICVFDVDQDGKPEIVDGNGDGATDFNIFESTGDNLYELIFTGNPPHSASSTFAFGDFDLDGDNEFVFGSLDGSCMIHECTGDNTYQEIDFQYLPTGNIKDCCAVSDADQDGKWEFVVKGFAVLSAEIHAFIFEATGDNTYEVIETFTLPGGDYDGGYSEAGDVDGDSVPEIVLEARYNVFIIKASGDNAFYVWDTLPGFSGGSSIRVTDDIDGNGLNEIVISGNNYTRIYEYDGGEVEERREYGVGSVAIDIAPNPFTDETVIRLRTADQSISESGGGVSAYQQSEIRIYDATGRLVKSFSLPTTYSILPAIAWDGTDDFGRSLSSGVYFVHLKTVNHTIVEKIVLLK